MFANIVILVMFLGSVAYTEENYHCVVIGKASQKHKAVKIAKTASLKLNCQIDKESLSIPRKSPFTTDFTVSIYSPTDSEYVVTTYVGSFYDGASLRDAFEVTRKHFKDAELSSISVISGQLYFDISYFGKVWVIILGSEEDYHNALAKAKKLSAKTGVPFSTRGLVYDQTEGLIWPGENSEDPYAGIYFARRYDSECDEGQGECITVEMSDAYDGFRVGFYIIMGGIYSDQEKEMMNTKLKEFRKLVSDAYAKSSFLYYGCRL